MRNPHKLKIGFLQMISQPFISTPIKTSTCLFRAINALLQVLIKILNLSTKRIILKHYAHYTI